MNYKFCLLLLIIFLCSINCIVAGGGDNSIEYTQYNGRDTVIEDKQDNFTKTISFEGWLDLGQIIERLRETIEE